MSKPSYWEVSSRVGNYMNSGFLWELFLHSIEHGDPKKPYLCYTKTSMVDFEQGQIVPINTSRVLYTAVFSVKMDHVLLCADEADEIIRSAEQYLEEFLETHQLKFNWVQKCNPKRYFRGLGKFGAYPSEKIPSCGLVWSLGDGDTLGISIMSKDYWEHSLNSSRYVFQQILRLLRVLAQK
ncbi:MAG: hypothetical protein ABIA11_02360 [Patescibacteria group bacterium]